MKGLSNLSSTVHESQEEDDYLCVSVIFLTMY